MTAKRKSNADQSQQHRITIIERPFISPQMSCDRCIQPSGMITPDEAAALCQVSTRIIYRWLEGGAIHFTEEANGALLICLSSLAATAENEPRLPEEADQSVASDSVLKAGLPSGSQGTYRACAITEQHEEEI